MAGLYQHHGIALPLISFTIYRNINSHVKHLIVLIDASILISSILLCGDFANQQINSKAKLQPAWPSRVGLRLQPPQPSLRC